MGQVSAIISGSGLPAELWPVIEDIARRVHERWMKERIAQGYVYGEVREGWHHPLLVPYENLTEADKDLDRATAVETVSALVSLGFRIEKNNS